EAPLGLGVRGWPRAARFGDRREVLVPAGERREYPTLELEPVMRLERVVQLDSCRVEIAVLAEDVVRCVGKEHERRVVGETRRIVEASVTEERAGEQFVRLPGLRGHTTLEPTAPAEVDEPVQVLLAVCDDTFHL